MIRDICKDEAFWPRNPSPPPRTTFPWGKTCWTTLAHHKEECVGMARQHDRREQAQSSSSTTRASTR